jgi:DNA-binding transcriptional MerR regulator
MSGWIKIHRKFLDWEWFNKSEAVHLFMYLVLKANHKDGQWQGIDIKKGQFITSFGKISTDTGISLQTIRTLLKKFEKSNEINIQTTNKYSVVTICKYECYQKETETTNEQLTNKQQTTNNQLTTNKNDKNNKEIYIPEFSEFLSYAISQIPNVIQQEVKLKYDSWIVNDWKDGNNKKIVNWKSKLNNTLPFLKKHEIQKERIIFD